MADGIATRIADSGYSPVLVVGHSTGGAIALQLAPQPPAPGQRPGPGRLRRPHEGARRRRYHRAADPRRRHGRGDRRSARSVIRLGFASASPADVADELVAYATSVDPRSALEVLESQRILDFTDRMAELRCLAAVVHGVADPVRTVTEAQEFASMLPGASLTLLECGRSPPFEALEKVADLVRQIHRQLLGPVS